MSPTWTRRLSVRRRDVLIVMGIATCGLFASGPARGAEIIVSSSEPIVLGEPVRFRITGLPPNEPVTVTAELVRRTGKLWRSSAVFVVPPDGEVDPARHAPGSGTWSGVDPLGLFWSMQATEETPEDWPGDPKMESIVRLRAATSQGQVAEAWHKRWIRAPGVKAIDVREQGLVATLLTPAGGHPAPGVVIVSGSGGGLQGQVFQGSVLASHGFAVLALAFFAMEGLPQTLADIPLEYIERAIDWFSERPEVDGSRIAMMGGSKGGELALLMGSRHPKIKAVVAAAPSSVVWASLPLGRSSSWSVGGEPAPYVPYVIPEAFRETGLLIHLYNASLEAKGWPAQAAIPVEKIGGPVLLISGGADAMWDSARMAEEIIDRLEKFEHPYASNHLTWAEAGHRVSGPGYLPTEAIARHGGTSSASALAQAQSWQGAVEFLTRTFAEPADDPKTP